MAGFGYDYDSRINTLRGAGQALGALLSWMETAACRWGEGGLAAWLRYPSSVVVVLVAVILACCFVFVFILVLVLVGFRD